MTKKQNAKQLSCKQRTKAQMTKNIAKNLLHKTMYGLTFLVTKVSAVTTTNKKRKTGKPYTLQVMQDKIYQQEKIRLIACKYEFIHIN